MVFLLMSLCAVLFPRGVMDEIWDLVGSVSECFLPTFAYLFDCTMIGRASDGMPVLSLPYLIVTWAVGN